MKDRRARHLSGFVVEIAVGKYLLEVCDALLSRRVVVGVQTFPYRAQVHRRLDDTVVILAPRNNRRLDHTVVILAPNNNRRLNRTVVILAPHNNRRLDHTVVILAPHNNRSDLITL